MVLLTFLICFIFIRRQTKFIKNHNNIVLHLLSLAQVRSVSQSEKKRLSLLSDWQALFLSVPLKI